MIELRGVAVHNLKQIDVDLPWRKWIVICGPSGSGKSSLALDTLFAEGQRLFLETLSPEVKQRLPRYERPLAASISGLPPTIAVPDPGWRSAREETVATAGEIQNHLAILFAKFGTLHCLNCGHPVRDDTPQSISETAEALPPGKRLFLCFRPEFSTDTSLATRLQALRIRGFARAIFQGKMHSLDEVPADAGFPALDVDEELLVVLDRLKTGTTAPARLRDSLENALSAGNGACALLMEADTETENGGQDFFEFSRRENIDGSVWLRHDFSRGMACPVCGAEYPELESRHFKFQSTEGACPACEGTGRQWQADPVQVIPDPSLSLRQGAVAPWRRAPHREPHQTLADNAAEHDLSLDVPYAELSADQQAMLWQGIPGTEFHGLNAFFDELASRRDAETKKFLRSWQSQVGCPKCNGSRLSPLASHVRYHETTMPEMLNMPVSDALAMTLDWQERGTASSRVRQILEPVSQRLQFLTEVGLDDLYLRSSMHDLSRGEAKRVAFARALASELVQVLYVLDEPSTSLHAEDLRALHEVLRRLRDRGNTLLVVDHHPAMLQQADEIVETGPEGGSGGGEILFQGPPSEVFEADRSPTGRFLARLRERCNGQPNRRAASGTLTLHGARARNLKEITVEIPLGVLCVVTGVSGAGKSSLVEHTLLPAVARALGKRGFSQAPCQELIGAQSLGDVTFLDRAPLGQTSRANPATYVKVFDEIRRIYAETPEARLRNYSAGFFSFNVEGGRCPACKGEGQLKAEMRFLPDVYRPCEECGGRRYRPEILEVLYRGRTIIEVLRMTVDEAFGFFRGQARLQTKLQSLRESGLGYLALGQPLHTLSEGESQRLRLAAHLAAKHPASTLFLFDEPAAGLHFSDVERLVEWLGRLLSLGHSVVACDHHPQFLAAADYLIDLGLGAGEQGGNIVATGTPEEIVRNAASLTGKHLAEWL